MGIDGFIYLVYIRMDGFIYLLVLAERVLRGDSFLMYSSTLFLVPIATNSTSKPMLRERANENQTSE